MDFLRSCYETDAHLVNGSDEVFSVRWFFCQDGALPFPGRHLFSSRNWEPVPGSADGIGEIFGADRPWVDGSVPPFDGTVAPGFDGKHFAGPQSAYEFGASVTDPPVGGVPSGLCAGCVPIQLCPDGTCSQIIPFLNQQLYVRFLGASMGGHPFPNTIPLGFRIPLRNILAWPYVLGLDLHYLQPPTTLSELTIGCRDGKMIPMWGIGGLSLHYPDWGFRGTILSHVFWPMEDPNNPEPPQALIVLEMLVEQDSPVPSWLEFPYPNAGPRRGPGP